MSSYGLFSYSLDKIKLTGELIKKPRGDMTFYYNKIRSWCENLPYFIVCVKSYENNLNFLQYRYMYVLRHRDSAEGSFVISEWYNGDYHSQADKPKYFMIEYNPNKEGAKIWQTFCQLFCFKLREIKKLDIAYDVPGYTMADVFIRSDCDLMSYGRALNQTRYISPKDNRSGRIKVYNKALERGDNNDRVRIEASIRGCDIPFRIGKDTFFLSKSDALNTCVEHLNSVILRKSSYHGDDWKTLALSFLTDEQLNKCLSLMGSQARAKYRALLCDIPSISLNLDLATLNLHLIEILNVYVRYFK